VCIVLHYGSMDDAATINISLMKNWVDLVRVKEVYYEEDVE